MLAYLVKTKMVILHRFGWTPLVMVPIRDVSVLLTNISFFQFYEIISILVLGLLFFYLLLSFYNLIWLSFASLGKLSKVMLSYRTYLRKTMGKDELMDNKELLGNLWDIYYNNKDLKLLLNLLAESSGLASSLRYAFGCNSEC